jgi:hypothetical protein
MFYQNMNDAAQHANCPQLRPGTTKVWYQKLFAREKFNPANPEATQARARAPTRKHCGSTCKVNSGHRAGKPAC